MILEIIAGALGVGVTASGWIFAYRARGESNDSRKAANESAERARISDAKAEAANARADHAEANLEASRVEMKSAQADAAVARGTLTRERREKAALLADLAKRGVAVGDVVVDDAIDRLYPHSHENDRGPEDPNGDKGRNGGPLPDDTPTDPGKPSA